MRGASASLRVGVAQNLLFAGQDTAAIMRAADWKCVNIQSRYREHKKHDVWD